MWRNLFRKVVNFFKSLWPFGHRDADDAPDQPSSGPFEDYLAGKMNPATARKVVRTFNKLQISDARREAKHYERAFESRPGVAA